MRQQQHAALLGARFVTALHHFCASLALFFQAANHMLDLSGLVIRRRGNPEDGGEPVVAVTCSTAAKNSPAAQNVEKPVSTYSTGRMTRK